MNILISIITGVAVVVTGFFGLLGNVSIDTLDNFTFMQKEPKVGTALTTITGTETVSYALKTTVNNNFTALNNGKMEVSTTSVKSITTLSNLVTVGALTSGSLSTGFTTVNVAQGGTGSTTLGQYQVLLGSSTAAVTSVSGWGTSGQFLTSQGQHAKPIWSTAAIDQAGNYTWTGYHTFNAASTTIGSATTTWSDSSASVGIGTTTPALIAGMCVASDVYIAGGLGVGVATTTDGNIQVSGDIMISGNLNVTGTSSVFSTYQLVEAASVLSTGDNDVTTITATCPTDKKVVGGGVHMGFDGGIQYYDFMASYPSANNAWTVEIVCDRSGESCESNKYATSTAICI